MSDKLGFSEIPKTLLGEAQHLDHEVEPEQHEGPTKPAPDGSKTGPINALGFIGAFGGAMGGVHTGALVAAGKLVPFELKLAGIRAGSIESESTIARVVQEGEWGLVKGLGAGLIDAGVDMSLQSKFGHIKGRDYFRATGLELVGMGLAAAAPVDLKWRLGLGAAAWLAGRIENHFEA